jgi:hypothetical protein
VAQVAITALALEQLYRWTAEAAFVLTLAAGGLSVCYACLAQQRMHIHFVPDDVKGFLNKTSSLEKNFTSSTNVSIDIAEMKHHWSIW